MAGTFGKALIAVLVGEAAAAAAAIALSPKAREAARPYLVQAMRKALAVADEMKDIVAEAKLDAERVVREIEAGRAGIASR